MLDLEATVTQRISAVRAAFAPVPGVPGFGPTPELAELAIPVARPLLPGFDRVSPYIAVIDDNRYYSNFGPLVRQLEARLAKALSARAGGDAKVQTMANGTMGLVAALLAQDPPTRRYCLLPSWTFAASAHAVLMAGLVPYFVDVDRDSGALTPEIAFDAARRLRHEVAAVMPVAPQGAPVDVDAWDEFQRQTGLAVAIDAAAGFDTIRVGRVPVVVSLHATKVLAAGEGGFVASRDQDLLDHVRRVSNFGFDGTRVPTTAATNAKMSEYHAAVGLASLDAWVATRQDFMRVAQLYRNRLAASNAVALPEGLGRDWVASTIVAQVPETARDAVLRAFDAAAIGYRMWWGDGCHTAPAFRQCPRDPLPVTRQLSVTSIGLPCFQDMSREQVDVVCDVLLGAIRH